MRWKSAQSKNQYKSLSRRQEGVIQTIDDSIKVRGVESKVDERKPYSFGKNQAITFKIELYV
ncbi:hypothetical protein AAGF08_12575 [Algoriphagus sp. SE2]|uniref:hypothetical protein n=1 Tax=Algoriphagus sp. SE2 TaxID=3141536 RepID=UPI0031CD86A3